MKRLFLITITLVWLMLACENERCQDPIQTTKVDYTCRRTNLRLIPIDNSGSNLFDTGVLDTNQIAIRDTSGNTIFFDIMQNSNDSLYGKTSIFLPPRSRDASNKGYCTRIDSLFTYVYNAQADTINYHFIVSYGDSTIKNDTFLLRFREENNPYSDPNPNDCVTYGPTMGVIYVYHVKNNSLILLNYMCSHGPCRRTGYFFIKYVKN